MPDVNLIIDGHAVTVPAGTNLVDAARTVEVAIPVFCYHPKLKPVGMCRMCLIEVYTPRIDPATRQVVLGPDGLPQLALMMNKLQPACVTPVSEGMVVKTTTEKVKFSPGFVSQELPRCPLPRVWWLVIKILPSAAWFWRKACRAMSLVE
jgi:NADH-quinone oxidoreductase subunit G